FTLPGLSSVDSRNLSGGSAINAVFSPIGDRIYVREDRGRVDSFSFNPSTGALGAAPQFSITVSSASTFFGIDQIAISPDGRFLYVPQTDRLSIFDASTGALLS